jgi:hypothetical protein
MAKYSTWLYIYIFLITINVNKRETLIKQIGYSQVSYKIYGKKSLFTDDDVQRLAMAVKNLMLDDLRKELRQDMHLCINNATSPLYAR